MAVTKSISTSAFIVASFVSHVGAWIQNFVILHDAYHAANTAASLATTIFFAQASLVLSALLGGGIALYFSCRTIVCWTQCGLAAQAFMLAWMYARGVSITPMSFYILAAIQGLFSGLELSAKQTLVSAYFGASSEGLNRGTHVYWLLSNASRLLGAGLAIIILKITSPEWCFIANGLSCLVLIGTLFWGAKSVKAEIKPARDRSNVLGGALRTPSLHMFSARAAIMAFFVLPITSLIASIAGGSFVAYQTCMLALGVGALVGNILGTRIGHQRQRKLLVAVEIASPAALLALSAYAGSPMASIPVFFIGVFSSASFASISYLLQSQMEADARSVANGVLFFTIYLFSSVGGLGVGEALDRFGYMQGLLVVATGLFMATSFLFLVRRVAAHIKPVVSR